MKRAALPAKAMKNKEVKQEGKEKLKEANTCIGLGLGVGTLGLGATVLAGATCPICYLAAPALVGLGIVGRKKAKQQLKGNDQPDSK